MEKARKINTLDYVRVIATLMVFMLHTLIFTSQKVGVDLNGILDDYLYLKHRHGREYGYFLFFQDILRGRDSRRINIR